MIAWDWLIAVSACWEGTQEHVRTCSSQVVLNLFLPVKNMSQADRHAILSQWLCDSSVPYINCNMNDRNWLVWFSGIRKSLLKERCPLIVRGPLNGVSVSVPTNYTCVSCFSNSCLEIKLSVSDLNTFLWQTQVLQGISSIHLSCLKFSAYLGFQEYKCEYHACFP